MVLGTLPCPSRLLCCCEVSATSSWKRDGSHWWLHSTTAERTKSSFARDETLGHGRPTRFPGGSVSSPGINLSRECIVTTSRGNQATISRASAEQNASEARFQQVYEENAEAADKSAPERVQRLLQRLPAHYRDVLTCRFLLTLSIRDTARRLGLTEANVKVMQFRALKRAAELESVVSDD